MQDISCSAEQEHCLNDSIKELKKLNSQLAKGLRRKEELTEAIIGALNHKHEGQKTYEYASWQIEVKTPFHYTFSKDYKRGEDTRLPDQYNPFKQSVTYSLDQKLCTQVLLNAPKKIRNILIEIIDKKPMKASVTIKERI